MLCPLRLLAGRLSGKQVEGSTGYCDAETVSPVGSGPPLSSKGNSMHQGKGPRLTAIGFHNEIKRRLHISVSGGCV